MNSGPFQKMELSVAERLFVLEQALIRIAGGHDGVCPDYRFQPADAHWMAQDALDAIGSDSYLICAGGPIDEDVLDLWPGLRKFSSDSVG